MRCIAMLKTFEARGINGHISVPRIDFAEDLNVITGVNGSGKTTVLKLLWYLVSGNLERIPQEMSFEFIELVTSDFEISLHRTAKTDHIKLYLKTKEDAFTHSFSTEQFQAEPPQVLAANRQTSRSCASVFFPTFRRIEGGFSLAQRSLDSRRSRALRYSQPFSALESALEELSGALTVLGHHFICSISTSDIVTLTY
jgi:energy-coupling factor transporter ATP-binding protein EcfA2